MLKEGIKRTATMIAVYLLCVGSVLAVLVYNFKTFEVDYTETALGTWESVQYFKNKTVHVYTEEERYQVIVTEDRIECVFLNGDSSIIGTFEWKNGYSGTVYLENGFESFVSIDMNTRGDFKLNVVEKGMIILLRKVEVD